MTEHDEHVDDLMSRALDGELSRDEGDRFRAHLAGCARCAEAFRGLEGAIAALRGRGAEPLDDAAVGGIVDAAMPVGAARPSGGPRWRRPVLLVSHAAALVLGLLLAWLLLDRAEPAPPTERIVRVEVPVEVPVETIREVPVPFEVVVTERIEVPVEVEVERIVRETVVQPVPSPLQPRWDEALAVAGTLATIASTGATAIGDALDERATRIAAASSEPPPDVVAEAGRRAALPISADAATAALVIRREGDRVRLSTRGTIDEVVPALIDALDSGEPAVAAAALDRLEGLRADLEGANGAPRARLTSFEPEADDRVDRAGGIRGWMGSSSARRSAGGSDASAADLWRAWWEGRAR